MPDNDKKENSRLWKVVTYIFVTLVVVGSQFVDRKPWMDYDNAACDNGAWDRAMCKIHYSKLWDEKIGKNTYYWVRTQVEVHPNDGSDAYNASAWKAPSWAVGPRQLNNGGKSTRTFDTEGDAKKYMRLYKKGQSYQCFFNPKARKDVAMRCRDTTIAINYTIGVVFLCAAFTPLFFLILAGVCGGILDHIKTSHDEHGARRARAAALPAPCSSFVATGTCARGQLGCPFNHDPAAAARAARDGPRIAATRPVASVTRSQSLRAQREYTLANNRLTTSTRAATVRALSFTSLPVITTASVVEMPRHSSSISSDQGTTNDLHATVVSVEDGEPEFPAEVIATEVL